MSKVNTREKNYSKLANNEDREDLWTEFYNNLYEVTYDKSGRERKKYSDFQDALSDFNDEFENITD